MKIASEILDGKNFDRDEITTKLKELVHNTPGKDLSGLGKQAIDICASTGEDFSELIDTVNSSWSNKSTNKYMVSFADVCSKIYNDEIVRTEYGECAKLLLSFVWNQYNWVMRHNGWFYR